MSADRAEDSMTTPLNILREQITDSDGYRNSLVHPNDYWCFLDFFRWGKQIWGEAAATSPPPCLSAYYNPGSNIRRTWVQTCQ